MPEGDTIHRTANRLRPALQGSPLVRLSAPRAVGSRPRPGESIVDVRAVGKHLFVDFDGGLSLETHMMMTGSWHLYRVGERWQMAAHLARAEVEVAEWVAVCFSAPVVKLGPTGLLGREDLGPDLCAPDADIDVAVERFARFAGDREVADAMLDQRIACGVGNVYKSEVLWAERVHPFTPAIEVDDAVRRRLLARAKRLLRSNLGPGGRTTVPGGLAVYDRRGRPCRACGTRIMLAKQGPHHRVTYWCPRCQPERRATRD